ncbi:YhdP family protein [Rhodoferax saidenbachensis]|uniref:TIGR02099 family protein n=1 Tax=Rhodoferax saidenbachensis TaxID=1484693 RepID=A0A1P8KEJ9_9BURK|nr:YhdP family protein [Rhodoferax saidenbachensis]APW44453.1 TIGR02099 family protein [Rhodoferax saidenbachensis]
MIEQSPTPTPWLKAGAVVAHWAMGLLSLAWITVALVWGGLHFLIVPRIGELRPWLEQQATRTLGVTVRIGAITARSNGLIPSFELNNISLIDAQGREALRLPSVLAALSPRSVIGLGFEQLYVEGLVLEVRRTADGRIWVAGMPVPDTQTEDGKAADWVFSQTELAIRHGSVHWTDEMRSAVPLVLNDVDMVLRNGPRTHSLRVDATPPPEWGSRWSASGVFKQPLLERSAGQWKQWQGQLYASFPQVDLAHLRQYVDVGVDLAHGAGALRAWADVDKGVVTGATADVQMNGVQVTAGARLQPLALRNVSGRVGIQQLQGGTEYFTHALQFETEDGLHWPGGNVALRTYAAEGRNPARGEITADKLDLAAMAQIAQRLPVGDTAHKLMGNIAPRGLVESLQGNWRGPLEQLEGYAAKGRISQLTVPGGDFNGVKRLGIQGLNADFDLNQMGGKAQLVLDKGIFDAYGILEEAAVPFDQLRADVQWQRDGQSLTVSASNVRFANADAQGELQFKWQSAPATSGATAGPGVLDLEGSLSRAEGTRVHRYLPLELDKEVRDYVRDAVLGGSASAVKFKLKGDLARFPYSDAKQGDFRISADVRNASYAYVPSSLLHKGSLPWPALQQVSGELVIDHATLQVKNASATLVNGRNLQISKAEATVSQLYGDAQVAVSLEAKGPLTEVLGFVNGSPLGALINKVLAKTTASGNADYRVKVAFPIRDVERATAQGTVTLAGNDVQLSPETPRLTRARGQLGFTETGITVTGGQARAVGGDVRIDGGLSVLTGTAAAQKAGPQVLRIQGTATAEGLRQAKELGVVARMAQYATGTGSYSATLGLRGGVPEVLLTSSLTGMALNLPAPFSKIAETPMPLRLETTAVRSSLVPDTSGTVHAQDQLQLDVGRLASVTYVRDVSGAEARVLRGAIAVGLAADESAPMPSEGVVANINVQRADLDAWSSVLSSASGSAPSASNLADMSYLPTSLAVRATELVMGGRQINKVVVGGGRDGLLWRANLDATELSGYVEYRQPVGAAAGRFYGRLARLSIGQSTAQEVESLLDDQPSSIPALDVVVEDFELRGKKLGRVEVDAVNLGAAGPRDGPREWRLNRFNIITPEAVLTASGNWTNINAQAASAPSGSRRNIRERRRTVMNFKLDINDAGVLLERFAMPGVVRRGQGKIEGQVAWMGSPITLDYPSLGGNFNVNVETGQFLKADPGIAKLLGVLSLQSLPRRLTLDFRDVFSEGFAFDFLRGDVAIEQGIARTTNLQMKGVNAVVLMDGQADIAKETQAIKVVVIPEINAGSASLIASAINPLIGLSTFLAQVILRGPLMQAATQELFIDGTWVEPRVTKVERKTAPAAPAKE